jgi:hypothetical protein
MKLKDLKIKQPRAPHSYSGGPATTGGPAAATSTAAYAADAAPAALPTAVAAAALTIAIRFNQKRPEQYQAQGT